MCPKTSINDSKFGKNPMQEETVQRVHSLKSNQREARKNTW